MFWSDAVMDGPLFAAINAPIADSLLQYREQRLEAAKTIAELNNYSGAYWPATRTSRLLFRPSVASFLEAPQQ